MKMRVWWWRDWIDGRKTTDYHEVSSVNEAIEKIRQLTKEDLKNRDIIANAYGLEIFDGEWSEYYDEEGRDINEIIEDIEEEE